MATKPKSAKDIEAQLLILGGHLKRRKKEEKSNVCVDACEACLSRAIGERGRVFLEALTTTGVSSHAALGQCEKRRGAESGVPSHATWPAEGILGDMSGGPSTTARNQTGHWN